MVRQGSLTCPCGEGNCRTTFEYLQAPSGETKFVGQGFSYRRSYEECRSCGHWYSVHEMPLEDLYGGDYVDATYGGVEGMRTRLESVLSLPKEKSDNQARCDRIEVFADEMGLVPSLSDSRRRILDIGSGVGVFPLAMARRGWSVTAVEPDMRTVDFLDQLEGVSGIHSERLGEKPDLERAFEIVTFNKVLEHVSRPAVLLASARRFLRPGGVCYVEVPHTEAALLGEGREEFFIEHHHVFSVASLAILATISGFNVLKIESLREPSGKFTVYAFLVVSDVKNNV